MTITLSDEIEELVNDKLNSGAYESADEVIRASLRLLQVREEGLEALRSEILLGVTSIQEGRFTSCDSDEELESFSDGVIQRAKTRAHRRSA